MSEIFSKRHNIDIPERVITIREDAPEGLRNYVPEAMCEIGKNPLDVKKIVSRVLQMQVNPCQVSQSFIVKLEIKTLLSKCRWYKVYDIIEALAKSLSEQDNIVFHEIINDYFLENGIGYKLDNGLIEIRGDDNFETAINTTESILEDRKLSTSKNEIKEAIKCLSRRPDADTIGAVNRAIGALECLSREVVGDKKLSLGKVIEKNPGIVPSPLNEAISKIWGYSSNYSRHVREGIEPQYEEAELLVYLSATLCTYLAKKHIPIPPSKVSHSDDLPF